MAPRREQLERLPKVELHCHLEGTMRPVQLGSDGG